MCGSQRPLMGADSGVVRNFLPDGSIEWVTEPIQATCGHWVETANAEGFCALEPNHDGRCQPPTYEVTD